VCVEVHNTTVENASIPASVLPPKPTLRDVLSPRVGDKLLQTDNEYQQDLLLGSELVHQPDENQLLISPNLMYRKHVRKEVPPSHHAVDMTPPTDVEYRRGMRRWTALPDASEVCQSPSVHANRPI